MKKRKVPVSIYFITIISLLAFTLLCMFLVYDATAGKKISGRIGEYFAKVAKVPQRLMANTSIPNKLIAQDRFLQKEKYYKNTSFTDSGYLLISSYSSDFKQTVIKLLRLSDGHILHIWKPNLQAIKSTPRKPGPHFKPQKLTASQFRTIHPVLLKNKSIVIKGEYGIYKLDSNSKIIWHKEGHYHHSTEIDINGNFWIASVCEPATPKNTLYKDLEDDAIVQLDTSGNVLFKKSIAEILIENGYEYIVCGVGVFDYDAIHVNDIQPATFNSRYWSVGDILINIRNKSTMFIYRPSTNKIIWLKTGSWINQHDASFLSGNKIIVLNNHAARLNETNFRLISSNSSVMVYDFAKDSAYTIFNNFMSDNKILVPREGRCLYMNNGDIILEESGYGRILRGNDHGIQWCYIERLGHKKVSIIQWSRYYAEIPN